MKFFAKSPDGGPDSPVTGWFIVEIKSLFSIVLLRFGGSREAFHSHAFNAVTLWLKGRVQEMSRIAGLPRFSFNIWKAGQFKYTPRNTMHKVLPLDGPAWAISFRGPWAKTWQEFRPTTNEIVTLAHGRKIVSSVVDPDLTVSERFMEAALGTQQSHV